MGKKLDPKLEDHAEGLFEKLVSELKKKEAEKEKEEAARR